MFWLENICQYNFIYAIKIKDKHSNVSCDILDKNDHLKVAMQQEKNDNMHTACNGLLKNTYQSINKGCQTKGRHRQQQRQQISKAIEGSDLASNRVNTINASNEHNMPNDIIFYDKCISNNTIINDNSQSVEAFHTELFKKSVETINTSAINVSPTKHAECVDDNENDDWEKMFNDNGECLDNKINKLTTNIKKNMKIEENVTTKATNIVACSQNTVQNNEEYDEQEETELSHVLEVSNFPVEFRTHDLLMIFSQYKESGFDIKWVDDTHALLVFSSSRVAKEVLNAGHPLVMLKPLKGATVESQLKAKKCALYIQPYRARPETCVALARRLVTGALGVRLKTAAIERENEKRILNKARERKLQTLQQQQKQRDAWDS